MNINRINSVMKIYDINGAKNEIKSTERVQKRDELKLSSSAKDYQFAMEQLKGVPDVREDRVAEIRKNIESGNYSVDSRAVADRIYKMAKGEF